MPKSELIAAIDRLTLQFKRFNDRNEPARIKVGEPEVFRAQYSDESEEQREMHEHLVELEEAQNAARAVGRSRTQTKGRGTKAIRA